MTAKPKPRVVAGLSCLDVLEALPDFLDGTLPPEVRDRANAHLRGCDWCTRFGGDYAATIDRLRTELVEAEDAAARERLAAWARERG